jgi:hypothetical protein
MAITVTSPGGRGARNRIENTGHFHQPSSGLRPGLAGTEFQLYLSANNRDGGRPGDAGGTIQRISPSGTVEDFSDVGLPNGPGEPAGIAFGRGALFGDDLYVTNGSDLPGDILRVNAAGTTTPFVNDGITGWYVGLAPFGLAFRPGGSFGDGLYFIDFGGDGNPATSLMRIADSSGNVSSPFGAFSFNPRSLEFAPGGPFGTDLYVAAHDAQGGSIYRVTSDGNSTHFASGFQSFTVDALQFSPDGTDLFVADYAAGILHRITSVVPPQLHIASPVTHS